MIDFNYWGIDYPNTEGLGWKNKEISTSIRDLHYSRS